MARVAVSCLLLLALVNSGACQIKNSPECSGAEAAACGDRLVPFLNTCRVPETPKELEARCELEKADVMCAETYVEDCVKGFFRGVSFAALNAIRKEFAGRCNISHSDHKRYLAGSRCLNKAGDRIHGCYQTFKRELHRIVVKAAPERKLEHGCCETSRLFQCKQRSIEEACGNADVVQLVQESFEHRLGDLVKVYCGRYEYGSSDCAALDELPELAVNETVPQGLSLLLKSYVSTFG